MALSSENWDRTFQNLLIGLCVNISLFLAALEAGILKQAFFCTTLYIFTYWKKSSNKVVCVNRICEEDELELEEDTTDEENRPLMMKLNFCSSDNKGKNVGGEIQGIP